MLSVAFSMAARTLGSGPCTVSLLAILIAPGTVLPGVYAGRSASSGRRRAVTRPVYGSLTCALPSPVAPVYAVGSAVNVRRRARAAEWGSLLMSCRPQRRPEVQILSPPPRLTRRPHNLIHAPVAQRIEHLTTDQKVGGSNPFGRARKHPLTCRDASAGMFCSCRESLYDTETAQKESRRPGFELVISCRRPQRDCARLPR